MTAAVPGAEADSRARLVYPTRSLRAYAVYAARLPEGTAPSWLPAALAAQGIAVLALDLGASQPGWDAATDESDAAACLLYTSPSPRDRS